MVNRLADLIIKRPWLYIVLFSVITVFFAAQFPGLEVDPELKNELPADMPSRVALDNIDELASVLCHEIAHVSARHLAQRMEQSKKI